MIKISFRSFALVSTRAFNTFHFTDMTSIHYWVLKRVKETQPLRKYRNIDILERKKNGLH
ncbi:hypothetical protein JHK84_031752 [Glycine max]|uniref:Uncharacterized protein n=1 Tax=Glycine max TaxID=3847 RepID=K7LR28_SOYBN|nr:hypothetical protein JHK85_032180 [Glycine max]KAG4994786.1 hypothetical protein JHK86_031613 [Glycine max]KAG5146209.1 hypothetical protein JHK84_031752 [Glycine max]KAH1159679.1 hypothetical protein GYH30_031414 [Glycine max]